MFFLGTWDRHEYQVDEIVFDAGTFVDVIREAVDAYGYGTTWLVYWGDDSGPSEEIAYHDGSEPNVLFVLNAEHMPSAWRPGGTGGERLTPRLAPEAITTEQKMVATSERGYAYPAVLQALENFEDLSYGNDVTDSVGFVIGPNAYVVFVEPARVMLRSREARDIGGKRFSMWRCSWNGKDDEIDWQADVEVCNTDRPDELVRAIEVREREYGGHPSARRFRLMDMEQAGKVTYVEQGPSPTSQRAALLELNGRRHRQNPGTSSGSKEAAKAKYEEFHRFAPKKIGAFASGFTIPKAVFKAGRAKWVTYRSGKVDPSTLKKPRSPVDYIHEHDAGVVCYLTTSGPHAQEKCEVPEEFRDVEALTLLGINLGFCFETADGEEIEAQSTAPMPELYATPDGKCLIVVQSKRAVIAMEWGGALGVFARGIDG